MVRPILTVAFMLASLAFGWQLGIWHAALMTRLRERHTDTWQRLGRPHSAWAGWTWTTLSFLLSRQSSHLGDPQFSVAARRFRTGFLLWPIVGVGLILLSRFLFRG